jgi:peptide/nickel transport system permease protein
MSATATAAAPATPVVAPRSRQKRVAGLRRARAVVLAALFLVALIGLAVAAPLVAPHDPSRTALIQRLRPPVWDSRGDWTNPLGTDALGRDILSRLIFGARISLLVGASAVLVGGTAGVLAGLVAGFYGAWIEAVLMRLGDVQLALPFILLALAIMAAIGPGLVNVIVVLALGQWVEYARIVRGEVLSLREREFVDAARILGQRDHVIVRRHVLPNVLPSVVVLASLSLGTVILAEASLTFLGAGVGADVPSWGGMIAEGREYMSAAAWIAAIPGVALMVTILAINLIGDWLRDVLDPRLRHLV